MEHVGGGAAYWDSSFFFPTLIAVACGLALASVVLAEQQTILCRVLELRPVMWLGVISYGVYLWHFPVIQMLSKHSALGSYWRDLTVTTGATLVLAAASWYAIEKPALRLRRGKKRERGAGVANPKVVIADGAASAASTTLTELAMTAGTVSLASNAFSPE